ncbi:hypothetical protein CL617_03770 [archaeon]|nr:hypothetical protein [archaeon]
MKLVSFAYDFVSYLLYNLDNKEIDRIFLFGSVVRGEATKESDVDIFIESGVNIEDKINKITDEFYQSAKYLKYWKPLNVKNQIRVISGKLDDFPDLKRSIVGNGLVLYSSFKEKIRGNNYSLFTVEFKGEFKDKVRLWRKLYGSKQKRKNKTYISKGIIEKSNGKKISRGVFIIPIERSNDLIKDLKKLKIKYNVFDVSSDTL